MDDEADTGGAERAFEALRAEVAALRQAVEGQTAPDYALTLGAIVKELQAVGARLDAIEAAPALAMTPATIAQQIRAEAAPLAEGRPGRRRRRGRVSSGGGRRSRTWRSWSSGRSATGGSLWAIGGGAG